MGATESQPAATTPKLRWFQYRLRSLLLITLLASIGMSGWLVVKKQRERRRITNVLKEPTRFYFAETPLTEVVDYFHSFHHIDIQIDKDALRAAGMGETMPVTLALRGVSLQSALRLLLRDLDMTYTNRGKVLWITTWERAAARGEVPPIVELDDAPEKKIVTALKERTQIDFVETPLNEVLDYLEDLHHINVQVDYKALCQADINYNTPVTLKLKNVSLQSALRLMLGQLGLYYLIRDEVLFITTKGRAAAMKPRQPDLWSREMADNEAKIVAALKEPTKMDFAEIPLKDVVEYLDDFHHIKIQLDNNGIRERGFDNDVPVTVHVKSVSLQSALTLMLRQLGLDYVIQDEVLLITSENRVKR